MWTPMASSGPGPARARKKRKVLWMYGDRWELVDGFTRYEFELGGGYRAPVPSSMFFGLRDWLERPWTRRVLLEIAERVGPSFASRRGLRSRVNRDEELAELLIEAVETGRLVVTEHDFTPRPVVLPRPEIILKPLEGYVEERVDLALVVRTLAGDPVEDEAGFLLVNPDNTREYGKVSSGDYGRKSVVPGSYDVRFRHLHTGEWSAPSIHPCDEVEMRVTATQFEDGTEVTFKVFGWSHPSDAKPLAEVKAKVKGEKASATWRHVQEPETPARTEYVFEVECGKKWASSCALPMEPRPASETRGIKERLVALGYDCGAGGPEETPAFEEALKQYQEAVGYLDASGKADPETLEALEGLV